MLGPALAPALWAPESWPLPCPAAGNTSPLCTEMTRGRSPASPRPRVTGFPSTT